MNIEQDITSELYRLRQTAVRMDALFRIPRTNITVGLDNIFGLVPIVGDAVALAPSLWIIWQARKLGATNGALAYMLLNSTLDFAVGAIPVVGDIFDMVYNANIRNVMALERNLDKIATAAKPVQTARTPVRIA